MTQKQFAKYLRVAPSQISRWKDQERLVMVDTRPRPMVNVRQSLDLLVATADPSDYVFRDTPVPWWLQEAWADGDD